MNKYLTLLIVLFFCLTLTGCWNYTEINSFYIVAGIAIDKDKDTNQYIITTELLNIKDNKLGQSYESIKVESKGDAIFEAIRSMIRISSKKLYWSHATTIIISEEVARDSILPILDWFVRDKEPRLNINVYISGEKTGKELLNTESLSTDIRSYELDTMVNENSKLVKAPSLKVYEIINELYIPKTHIVLPTVRTTFSNGIMTNILSGGAVFNKDKMSGFLNEEDILPYLFLKNKVNGGFIKVKTDEDNPNNTIILEIFDSKTKIKPTYSNDNIGFDINVISDVAIAELTTRADYLSKPGIEALKMLSEKSLKTDLENIVKKVQQEFGLDIFGFGNIIRQRNPKLWKEVEKDWDSIFTELELNINCKINIRNKGHFSTPIEVNN